MLILRLGPPLNALALMVGTTYARPTDPGYDLKPAERLEFDMTNFRDDFCLDCIDLCADPKIKIVGGRRFYVNMVKRVVVSTKRVQQARAFVIWSIVS